MTPYSYYAVEDSTRRFTKKSDAIAEAQRVYISRGLSDGRSVSVWYVAKDFLEGTTRELVGQFPENK